MLSLFRRAGLFALGAAMAHSAVCAAFGAEAGTLKLDQYYTSGAVLQCGVALPVSGQAAPGAAVKVGLAGATASATADAKGRWVASLPARAAGGPHALEVTSGAETLTATNLLVGEVWLVSGQSNAYFPINRFAPKEEWLKDADCPKIRFMEITWQPPHMRRPDRWNVVTPQTAGKCSATGFFFAKDLQRKMNGVPVGVVVAASDGSIIQKWLSEDALRKVPGMPEQMAKQAAKSYAWLYETYIAPMIPFPFAGVIWYQGESNGMFAQGYDYRFYLQEMIRDWRARWNTPLPFLVVQLPHYDHSQIWGDVRDSQNWVSAQEQNVFVVPTFDIGDMKNIHPPRKPELGARLSAFARHFVYGEDSLTPEGPVYESVEPKGGELLVRFRARAPLASRDGQPLRGFHVAGKDGKFVTATVRIADERTLAVSAARVPEPVAVRYGWLTPEEVNFFDADGRVAGAFRSDTFRLPTQRGK